jgi:hypothetical protein
METNACFFFFLLISKKLKQIDSKIKYYEIQESIFLLINLRWKRFNFGMS